MVFKGYIINMVIEEGSRSNLSRSGGLRGNTDEEEKRVVLRSKPNASFRVKARERSVRAKDGHPRRGKYKIFHGKKRGEKEGLLSVTVH
ncbi:hypothetical protein V6N12_074788 [Hibiscus sabdariffa]|uniref:Uncharacterized protein n=1 Tax=Hibiscus sabdariffa TaxID=183260 RepID=A0ABR2D378_9ROSI